MTRSAIYHNARRELIQRHPKDWEKTREEVKALHGLGNNVEAEIRKLFIMNHYDEYRKIVDELRGPRKPRMPKMPYEELLNHPEPIKVIHSRARAGTQAFFLRKYPSEVFYYREKMVRKYPHLRPDARSEHVFEEIRKRHPGEWKLKYEEILAQEKAGLEAARALHESSGKVVQHNESKR